MPLIAHQFKKITTDKLELNLTTPDGVESVSVDIKSSLSEFGDLLTSIECNKTKPWLARDILIYWNSFNIYKRNNNLI